MCGICGIWKLSGENVGDDLLDRMTRSIQHRGPDDHGTFIDGPVGLGFRRLAIIDLTPTGRQPMSTSDDRFTITFNGEIYNFQDIRSQLVSLGHQFRGSSDTEVLLNSFAEWGTDAFEKFNGMFGLAIWDRQERRLVLARDRFGIKPLFYYFDGSSFVFGSEIKALLASGMVDKQLNWQAFHEYLYFGASLDNRTFFDGICQLKPGHVIQVESTGLTEKPFASVLDFQPVTDDYSTATGQVRRLLDESVERHLISDVPVGAFLSGGIDSASIVAIATQKTGGNLETFTARFDYDKSADETANARLIADTFGTNHHELDIRAGNISDVVAKLVECHDVPFGDMANLPLYLLCEALGGTPKVILQGDGGDEVFGGYKRYDRIARRNVFKYLGSCALLSKPFLPKTSVVYRSLNTFFAFSRARPDDQLGWLMSQERFDALPERVFRPDVQQRFSQTNAFMAYQEMHHRLARPDRVQEMMLTDCLVILPNQYFEKVDRATMAHGIEVRVPMVDVAMAKYVCGLPTEYKVQGASKKRVLRDAMRGTVPDSILDGPKKGFGVPVNQWLREPLFDFVNDVLKTSSVSNGFFDEAALGKCMDEHRSGRANHGDLLYKLLNFCIWMEKYSPSYN